MVVIDRTASSKQLVERWSIATGVLKSASSIRRRLLHRGFDGRLPLYRIPFTANHRRLRLQWAHEQRAWQAEWHQVVFSDESRFNLWDHDGRIHVRRYTGERCLPYNRYARKVLQPEVVPFLKSFPGAIFQQVNARSHVAKTVRDFCSAQHMQLLPLSAYSPDMSPIELAWDLVGQSLARDERPAASKDERFDDALSRLPLIVLLRLFGARMAILPTNSRRERVYAN
ncbi:transposable element Tc1 transposase [Trichonephila clavipes]|nr:transposable element Tc1 transposase [Trichonephila clavipes]